MKNKVLIIDDDSQICLLLKTLFTRAGYEVDSASSGFQGLNLSKIFKPDLICLDYDMPGLSGVQVYDLIKVSPWLEGVKVVFMSGQPESYLMQQGLDLKDTVVFKKPFQNKDLLRHVFKTLEKPSAVFL